MVEGSSSNGTQGITVAAVGSSGDTAGDGQEGVESALGKIGERMLDDVANLRKSERFRNQLVGTGKVYCVPIRLCWFGVWGRQQL